MVELYTPTIKYIGLAITEFTPTVQELMKSSAGSAKKELRNILDMYSDISTAIAEYNLNFTNPNRSFPGEPNTIRLDINDRVLEHLCRLALRLLNKWKSDLSDLENNIYITEPNRQKRAKLKDLIWPLDSATKSSGHVLNEYKSKGPIMFPGEERSTNDEAIDPTLVFISYSTKNKTIAGMLKSGLEKYGLKSFLAHEDISPSQDWQRTILVNLSRAAIFMPLITPDFKGSNWTDQECGMAHTLNKLILPIAVDGREPYGFIGKFQAHQHNSQQPIDCYGIIQAIAAQKPGLIDSSIFQQDRLTDGERMP